MGPELIRPNLHVVLIHYPLALLSLGLLIELGSFLWPSGSLRPAGRWMIGLGAFLSIVAAFSGIYALADIAQRHNPAGDAPWSEVRPASPLLGNADAWQTMRQHVIFQSASAGLCATVAMVWLGLGDRTRRAMHAPLLILLLCGVGIALSGAWFGGEMVYRHGAGVDPTPPQAVPGRSPVVAALPPLAELHVIAAGCVVAAAMASIGLSCRKITSTFRLVEEDIEPTAIEMPLWNNPAAKSPRIPPTPLSILRTFNPGLQLAVEPFTPAARFWLLATVLAVGTAAGGLLMLINDSDAAATAHRKHQSVALVVWNQIKPEKGQAINRLLGHLVAGSLLIATPAVLGLLARFSPRNRLLLGLFTLILLAAVATQIWLGVLLLLDTSDGPVDRFNPPAAVEATLNGM